MGFCRLDVVISPKDQLQLTGPCPGRKVERSVKEVFRQLSEAEKSAASGTQTLVWRVMTQVLFGGFELGTVALSVTR